VDDADFDMNQHLLPFEGSRPRSLPALFRAFAEFHAEPLDLGHAPWQMQIMDSLGGIPGLPESCFAIFMKYHHAAIDGASGARLINSLHGIAAGTEDSRVRDAVAGNTEQGRKPSGSRLDLLVRSALNQASTALTLTQALSNAAPGIINNWLTGRAAGRKSEKPDVPMTRFNAAVSAQRVMHALTLDFSRLQALRKTVPGATINDVLLAICGGALRRWLIRNNELPEESLVAMVPVNTRDKGVSDISGNQISTLFLPIGTNIEHPLQRLQAIRATSQKAKAGDEGISPQQLNTIGSHLPAMPLALTARLVTGLGLGYRGPRLANCTITNVPLASTQLRLGPAPMVYTIGNGPLIDGMGLIISIFSYAGVANLCFTSCPEMLPDPALLARDAEREIKRMEQLSAAEQ
jgi:WS/DGAT/MGAT family acyltransferase